LESARRFKINNSRKSLNIHCPFFCSVLDENMTISFALKIRIDGFQGNAKKVEFEQWLTEQA